MSWVATAIVASAAYGGYQANQARKTASQAADAARAQAAAEAEAARQAELKRQSDILAGREAIDEAYSQFDDDFYNNRSQSYLDFALPSLEQEYEDTARALTSALARSGNLNSSIRGERLADLNEQMAKRKIDIQNQADDYANQARTAVESSKQDLYTTNQSLADPTLVRGNATAQVANLSNMPSFSPLGDLLSDFTSGLSTQADLERRQMANNNLLFNNNPFGSGSGRTVG